MNYINDIRELIGNTPLLKLNHLLPNFQSNIFAKLECLNPGGSIKDRVGMQIIADAEASGLLKPGYTIIEATAGNTGIGLALAAFQKGYKLKITSPAKFSIEKQTLIRALGAELILTPSDDGIEGAIAKANELAGSISDSFVSNQFDNISNVTAHTKTGEEIYTALDGNIDILVAGAGSGGTITGIASYLKAKNPSIKIVLADPVGSILGGGDSGTYHIEGIGNHFIPSIFDSSYIDEVEKISDEEAHYYVQLLAQKEGVIVGASSGAAIAAAIHQAEKATQAVNIVTIFPDRGDRYFSQNLYDTGKALSDYRFNELFDSWSESYDDTIVSKDGEYLEVFKGYEDILNEVSSSIKADKNTTVLDIGTGTGNLAANASNLGYNVIGIEPNFKMRQLAKEKYSDIEFKYGSFLTLDIPNQSVSAILSSYAFHHLEDREKREAIIFLKSKLLPNGQIIFADTMYETEDSANEILAWSQTNGLNNLLKDLKSEFYTTHKVLKDIFEEAGFKVSLKQMNKFVWVLDATLAS